MPNFVKIGPSYSGDVAIFLFSKWPPVPSCIFEFAKYYWLTTPRGCNRITVQNCVKTCSYIVDIL